LPRLLFFRHLPFNLLMMIREIGWKREDWAGFLRHKRRREDATLCLIKDGIFFLLFLSNDPGTAAAPPINTQLFDPTSHFKGTLTRDFRPVFVHQTTSHGSLIHRLKLFRIWLRIREDNRKSLLLSGVIDTAVTCTAVSIIIWGLTRDRFLLQRCYTQLWRKSAIS
jgi:hypothetical protein